MFVMLRSFLSMDRKTNLKTRFNILGIGLKRKEP